MPITSRVYEHMICKVDAETSEEALELAMQGEYYDDKKEEKQNEKL